MGSPKSRAELLDAAVEDAIAFLRAWPPHPATSAKIRDLERQRAAAGAVPAAIERSLVGAEWAPSGMPVMSAELCDGVLHVFSGDDPDLERILRHRLAAVE